MGSPTQRKVSTGLMRDKTVHFRYDVLVQAYYNTVTGSVGVVMVTHCDTRPPTARRVVYLTVRYLSYILE